MEMERKDIEPKVIQPAVNVFAGSNEKPLKSKANKTIDKEKCASKCRRKKTSQQ